MGIRIEGQSKLINMPDRVAVNRPKIISRRSNALLKFAPTQNSGNTQIAIGDFKQGSLNDCWLCVIAKSLSQTAIGRQQLSRMIKKNPDNTYTVTFAGNKQFTVTEEELQDDKVKYADGNYAKRESAIYIYSEFPFIKPKINPNITYSTGDKNLRLIEIAANKYVHELVEQDIKAGRIPKEDKNKYCLDNYVISERLLFGETSPYPITAIDLNKLNASDILQVGTNSDAAWNGLRGNGISHHAYAVKEIDKINKKIYLINPHNTKEPPLCLSFEDFYNRYGMVMLKGSYKENYSKTKLAKDIHHTEFIKNLIELSEKQSEDELQQVYITAIPNMYKEMGDKNTQAKVIAQIIELSSKGLGTHDNAFIGAVLSIDDKRTLQLVNKHLSSIQNPEYATNSNNALETYISEEFSFSTRNKLLDHIKNL